MAIEQRTLISAAPNQSSTIVIRSDVSAEELRLDLSMPSTIGSPGHWSNYPKGVVAGFRSLGAEGEGFDAHVTSTVPMGAVCRAVLRCRRLWPHWWKPRGVRRSIRSVKRCCVRPLSTSMRACPAESWIPTFRFWAVRTTSCFWIASPTSVLDSICRSRCGHSHRQQQREAPARRRCLRETQGRLRSRSASTRRPHAAPGDPWRIAAACGSNGRDDGSLCASCHRRDCPNPTRRAARAQRTMGKARTTHVCQSRITAHGLRCQLPGARCDCSHGPTHRHRWRNVWLPPERRRRLRRMCGGVDNSRNDGANCFSNARRRTWSNSASSPRCSCRDPPQALLLKSSRHDDRR